MKEIASHLVAADKAALEKNFDTARVELRQAQEKLALLRLVDTIQ
jgi:hypothetical protein